MEDELLINYLIKGKVAEQLAQKCKKIIYMV